MRGRTRGGGGVFSDVDLNILMLDWEINEKQNDVMQDIHVIGKPPETPDGDSGPSIKKDVGSISKKLRTLIPAGVLEV